MYTCPAHVYICMCVHVCVTLCRLLFCTLETALFSLLAIPCGLTCRRDTERSAKTAEGGGPDALVKEFIPLQNERTTIQ